MEYTELLLRTDPPLLMSTELSSPQFKAKATPSVGQTSYKKTEDLPPYVLATEFTSPHFVGYLLVT